MTQPSYRLMARLYLPLAASGLLMTLQQPVITASIAQTHDAQTALAAYGVALNMAVFLESPLQMLLPAANALVQDRRSFQFLRRFAVVAGLLLAGLMLALASPWLARLVVGQGLAVPPRVTEQVLTMLLVMAPWPLLVGWRRFYQGVLIRHGHSSAVGSATAARLLVLAAVVRGGLALTGLPGALLGGLALMAEAAAEALVVTAVALRVLRQELPESGANSPRSLNAGVLLRFYAPLAATSVLTIVTWPLLSAGISRAAEPIPSLAAWPLALSILWLLTTPVQMLQQVAIGQAPDVARRRVATRFGLIVGLAGSALLGLFTFSPLIDLFLAHIVSVPYATAPLVIASARILTGLPALVAGQSLAQGFLIAHHRTRDIQQAMLMNLVVVSLVLIGGVPIQVAPGATIAALAMVTGVAVESSVLWWKISRQLTISKLP